jgi:hypothetical protein
MKLLPLILISLLLAGCTFKRQSQGKAEAAVTENRVKLDEESRALTTGVVDVLSDYPETNWHVELALDLAKKDQQIEGMPVTRIDVGQLLARNENALKALEKRFGYVDTLLGEKRRLEAELKRREAELLEMGRLYEAEKNKSVVKRIWKWTIGTLGIGGIIALCFIFPVVIPIIGQFFGWVVAKIPALAGMLGVVSKKAFDGVVKGVGNVREKLKDTEARKVIDTELLIATDADHRKLIEARRSVLNV